MEETITTTTELFSWSPWLKLPSGEYLNMGNADKAGVDELYGQFAVYFRGTGWVYKDADRDAILAYLEEQVRE